MSKEKRFDRPGKDTIAEMVKRAGGIKPVAEHLKKSERIVYAWCSGERNIDYANWMQICIMADS